MKQKLSPNTQEGFTLLEMLVVIGIMGLVASIFVVNFAAFRGPRNLRIATNELVTNLRKIQSYTLSSRNTSAGKSVKYYMIKFNNAAGNNTSYQVQSINSDDTFSSALETINLPDGIIVRPRISAPQGLQLEQPIGGTVSYPISNCTQVAFSLPFSRVYLDGSCTMNTLVNNLVNLVGIANSRLTIVLADTGTNTTSTIVVNGISGAICVTTTSTC